MTLIDLRRRLERIEAERHIGAPTRILADRPMNDAEAAHALTNWRAWTADSRAELVGTTLCIQAPAMTEREWVERHVTAHRPAQAYNDSKIFGKNVSNILVY